MTIPIGTEVMVHISSQSSWIPNNPLKPLHGQTFVVKNWKKLSSTTGAKSNKTTYYELYGATSKYGIPYSFTEEDLIVL